MALASTSAQPLYKTPAASSFRFSNLCGTVYRQGNVVFTPDGNSVISPVGNRVSVFDLVNNKSRTLAFENRKNIARLALSPDSSVLISVDEDGRAVLVNFKRSTVLHHFNFKKAVRDIKFSPDGKFIAVTHGSQVQVWQTPSHLAREFAPFNLHRTYTGHYDDVLSITWSADSRFFLTTSKDMTARLYTLYPVEGYRPKTFAGHRDAVLAAYFSEDHKTIYTVSRDGAVFTWSKKADEEADSDEEDEEMALGLAPQASTSTGPDNTIALTRWGVQQRHYFMQAGAKVVSTTWHAPSNLLIVGFSTGVFGLWEMPSFTNVHTLSVSQEKITSVAVNASGEWLAFGASKLGQLLVWEWQSESYVLKQQGHYFDMNTLSFSADGQQVATGGDDGKVKIWNATSGFCFVTFEDHSSAVTAVEFAKQGQVVFSASLDGTVRAFDLIRYRNFRTFTTPSPVQFNSLAVDPSGEIVCAGGAGDGFEIYMWSTQTGKLIDILAGHEGPVSALAFSPLGDRLVSASWDKSIRVWDTYGRSSTVEPFQLKADALALAFRPDGKEVAVSTLDGQISFWDVKNGVQRTLIEGRKDVSGGRKADDRVTAANNSSGKSFNSLSYTADGSCVLAGGNSKHVCLYDARDGVLLRRFQISQNLSLDGTQEFLDSRKLTEAGPMELIDDRGDLSDLEDRLDKTLPGARSGDMSKRKYRPEARTKCVRFSPTGRSWAAASTEGLLVYSLDDSITFDPFELDVDITPASILETLNEERHYLKALVMSLRLNERPLIQTVYEAIPPSAVPLLTRQLPVTYLDPVLRFLATQLEKSPHVEFHLVWISSLFAAHGKHLRQYSSQHAATFRGLQKGLTDVQESIVRLSDDNSFTLQFVLDQQQRRKESDEKMEAEADGVDGFGSTRRMEIEL
ncbi:putative WD repeat protein [Rhodotorula toruloides ATCC 204091]|uniref:Putative WD repeat protein n=1 Tax=Rhodotorula toruloides TaxID=5286 RepID=A0A0K3CRA4_RHOTO|nr:putative WD repeat protein [Rhodotorula toruloides ATCC 204091]KAK4333769.1 Periodic tryptophan protein 2 [Rhodotorula toruloides]PRQ70246.1 putative WD repeat protein [Rhodotorula toruloides]